MAHREKKQEITLLAELISSDRCLEIHVSGNDGVKDRHAELTEATWWHECLLKQHADAVIFSEANRNCRINREMDRKPHFEAKALA